MNPQSEEQQALVHNNLQAMGNENGLSSVMSALIILKGVISTGFLTLPLSIAFSGVIPSVLAYFFGMSYCIICYTKIYEVRKFSRGDYLDVMEHAFGRKFRIFISIIIIWYHLGVSIAESSFILNNLPKILTMHTGYSVQKVFIAIPLFLITGILAQFRQIKHLRYFFSVGVFFVGCILFMIITVSVIRIADNGIADYSLFIVSTRSPTIIGTTLFAFSFSPVILNVAINMKQPHQFPTVIRASYTIVLLTMAFGTFLPYLAFGENLISQHQVSEHLRQFVSESILEEQSHWYIQAIIACVSISLIGTTLLLTVPLFYSVEGFFFPQYSQSNSSEIYRLRANQLPSSHNAENIFGKIGKYRTLIRTTLVVLIVLGGLFLSRIVNRFTSVSEVVFGMPMSSILPALAHEKLVSRSKWESAFNYLLIGCAVSVMILTVVLLF